MRAINTGHANAATYLNAAVVNADLGHPETCMALLKSGCAKFPDNLQLLETAALLYYSYKAYPEATNALKAAQALAADKPELLHIEAQLAEANAHIPHAARLYDTVAQTRGKASDYSDLSRALANSNQDTASIAAAEKAVSLDPQDPVALFNLIWRKHETGAFKDVEVLLFQLLDNFPAYENNAEALQMLAALPELSRRDDLLARLDAFNPPKSNNTAQGHINRARYLLETDETRKLAFIRAANEFSQKIALMTRRQMLGITKRC